jgi:hypothetical protein
MKGLLMLTEVVFLGCMVIGHVDPVKKEIVTQTQGCEIEQKVTKEGSFYMERMDNKRSATMSLPKLGKKSYYFYYTFGEDRVYFSDGGTDRPVSQGYGGI